MPPAPSLSLPLTASVHKTDTDPPKAVKLRCFLYDTVYCLRKNQRGFRIAEHQPPRAQSSESSAFTFDNGNSDDLKAKDIEKRSGNINLERKPKGMDSKIRSIGGEKSWSSWIYSGFFMADLADPFLGMAMQDGTEVQFKSMTLQKYVSAENGGGMDVTVSRDVASSWESFKEESPENSLSKGAINGAIN
ncbi:hypothetical protein CFP56_027035 [Quercus suber]|uniref:DUF7910 domain-containing protein n=2 Tax=Quercus suber TaxID=58331 RepID=A0AAW0JZV6_QUESU